MHFNVRVCVCACCWATWKHLVQHNHGSSGIVSRCVCVFWPHCLFECGPTSLHVNHFTLMCARCFGVLHMQFVFVCSSFLDVVTCVYAHLSVRSQTYCMRVCVCEIVCHSCPVKGQPDGQDNDCDQTL